MSTHYPPLVFPEHSSARHRAHPYPIVSITEHPFSSHLIISILYQAMASYPQPPTTAFIDIEVIPYTSHPVDISMYWTTATDVLIYLRDRPNERQAILEDIRRRTQGHPRDFIIYHPLLHQDLILHSSHNEFHFINLVNSLLVLEQLFHLDKVHAEKKAWA